MSPRQHLINALEAARRDVCAYGPHAATCDCKYGLMPAVGEALSSNARNCSHRNCEHTGCPELRDEINRLRALEREESPVPLSKADSGITTPPTFRGLSVDPTGDTKGIGRGPWSAL